MCDCNIKMDQGILNIRVGALIIRNQRILVSRKLGFPYEWLPGGRIRMQENSEQALWRELKEELGLSMGHARFLCIHENFSIEQTQNCAYHELCFYYLVSVKPDELPDTECFSFQEQEDIIHMYRWVDIHQLERYDIRPAILAHLLAHPDDCPAHIITHS